MNQKQKRLLISIIIFLFLITFLLINMFFEFNSIYNEKISNQIPKINFRINEYTTSMTEKSSLKDTINITDEKIAPGTSGKIKLYLDASESEVDIKYKIEATEFGNKPSNLKFSVINNKKTNIKEYSSIEELAATELNGIISKEEKIRTLEIAWIWPFETEKQNSDNEFGTGTVKGHEDEFNYSFSLKIIGVKA